MTHIVDGILELAFRTVERRQASNEAVALGIVAALRRLHAAAFEAGGEDMALGLRATLRDALIAANLERQRRTGQTPPASDLPPLAESARFAMAVLEDAAHSCLALHAVVPDGASLERATRILVRRLIDVLGAAPGYAALVDRISDRRKGQPAALVMPTGSQPAMN